MFARRIPSPPALRPFRDAMRGSRNKGRALARVRAWLPPSLYSDAIAWLLAQPAPEPPAAAAGLPAGQLELSLADQLFPSRFPPTAQRLGRYGPHPPTLPGRDVRWVGALLAAHADPLRTFVELRARCERALLTGAFEEALAVLAEIEATLGVSYWLVRTRLAVLQTAHGLEAQKRYATEVKRAARQPGVTAYIAHQVSVRNEPSVTPGRFVTQLTQQIAGLPLPADLRAFVRYHVVGGWPATPAESVDVLRYAAAASVVDGYEAMLYAARIHVAAGARGAGVDDAGDPGAVWREVLGALRTAIPDERAPALLFALGAPGVDAPTPTDAGAWAAFLSGDERGAAEAAAAALRARPDDFDAVQVIARLSTAAEAVLPRDPGTETGLVAQLATDLRAVVLKSGPVEAAATNVARVALNYAGFAWADATAAAVAREFSPVPDGAAGPFPPITDAELVDLARTTAFGTAAIPRSHPLRLETLSADVRGRYAAALPALPPPATAFVEAYAYPATPDVSAACAAAQSLLGATAALRHGDLARAVALARPLLASDHPYYRHRGARLVTHGLLEQGAMAECVAVLTTEFVANEHARHVVPVRDIADRLDPGLRRALGPDPSLAILFDAYSRYVDGAYDRYRRRAYEDVLLGAGVRRPTELRPVADRFAPAKLRYYLRHVCVPEVMYASTAYAGGSRELQEERIAVLQWLCELDPDGAEDYEAEILERARRIALQARRVEVEQSRIQVDFDAFARNAEKRLRETYERYVAYRVGGLTDVQLHAVLADAAGGNIAPLMAALATPADEPTELFNSMVTELRDEFVGSRDYGLDGFLSTRIRHGSLASELRSPLLGAHLVTQLDEAAGTYRPNEYWLGAARDADPARTARLDTALAAFARGYDALIREIVTEWVQIKRDPAGPGMIDLSLSADQMRVLEGVVGPDRAFEDFIFFVFTTLIKRLEPGLEAIRARIADVAKPRAAALLTQLQVALTTEAGDATSDLGGLLNAAQEAGTATQRAFDRVASWFTPSSQVSTEPLPLVDAIQIPLDVAGRLYPGFSAVLELGEAARLRVAGEYLQNYFHIFLILFENAARHAGTPDGPRVTVRGRRDGDALAFDVVNDVALGIDRGLAQERLAAIQAAIDESRYLDSMRTEGRTGFHKMYKMIRHDFLKTEFDPGLRPGFLGDGRFAVAFRLPLAGGA